MTNEQRQAHYDYCVALGMPEVLAATIAAQIDFEWHRKPTDTLATLVYGFKYWGDTVEGWDFWDCLSDCEECEYRGI